VTDRATPDLLHLAKYTFIFVFWSSRL